MAYTHKKDQARYARQHYERNKVLYKKRATKFSQNQRETLKQIVIAYLKTHPCIGCDEDDLIVLEFDHRDPNQKRKEIATMVRRAVSIETLMREIGKCDVMCANCHRRKTYKQLGWQSRH